MKVRDFAAELIAEIADELDYLVYEYQCSSPSCGHIVFEKEVGDDNDKATVKKYKILDYSNHEVTLSITDLLGEQRVIDLHEPESVDEIREWFEDLEGAFDSPNMLFNGFLQFPTIQPSQFSQPQPSHQITIAPNTQPFAVTAPYTVTTSTPYITQPSTFSGGVSGTINSSMWIGGGTLMSGVSQSQLTISNHSDDLFGFSSFGSIPLGP